ncbi:SNF2-related protein [Sterolibacterium denitrificans]|uniref:SNF2-related protein n=1 Tax=Sterolibacterium denitrificans TaxID=157592 RepID=A0A7Z7HNR1_9PROT|nr:DEAD/DEAH box helicase [Sterolibacterium denitrificans]SMB21224.1 SNF2-related protein [Sterolibacterium denitrificans]
MPADARLLQFRFDDYFETTPITRGQTLAEAGHASIEGLKTAPGKVRITGNCHGSRGKQYKQDIQLSNDGKRITHVTGICSCAEGFNCAHVVAVLTHWQSQKRHSEIVATAIDNAQAASSETLAWLQALEQPVARSEPARAGSGQQIRYVLTPADGSLALYKIRQLKDGSQGKPEPLRPDLHQLTWGNVPAWFQPDDMPILRLFLALQDNVMFVYESSQQLNGEEGAQLLRMALRTGRLHLESLDQPGLQPGETLPANLVWRRNAEGHQQLQIACREEGAEGTETLKLLPTWPPWYVHPQRHEIGPVSLDLPDELARRLLAAPPLDEIDALLTRLRLGEFATRHNLVLPLPDAAAPEQPSGKPRVILRLQAARFLLAPLRTEETFAVATPWFEYPGLARTAGLANPPPLLRSERGGIAVTVMRDLEAEAAAWALFRAHGLESYQQRLPKAERIDADAAARNDCLLPVLQDPDSWLLFLEQTRPALEKAGIVIEIDDDFPFQLREAEDWFVEVFEDEFNTNNDWFDLDLGVVVDGKRVSLVEPLGRLIANRPQLMDELRQLGDDERVPLPLDTRHVLPVPVKRLRAWLGPLLEFAGDNEHERPRLSRLNAGTLVELEALPGQWYGGTKLRELGHKLRDFSGIEEALPAPGFKATLRPYQQVGLNWLQFLRSYGIAGILADDMGLGKTIQTLAHLHLEKTSGRADLPSMIVMPTSLITNWCNEAEQFAPDLKVLTLHGPDRAAHFSDIAAADLIFTTYPLLVRDQEVLLQQEYHLLVLDEAQFIKNPKAHSHRVARQLKARHRLSLTGTPLENHLGELWAQYNFLMPGLLGDVRRFATVFRTPIEKQNDAERRQQLAERVRPFLLRRTKEQVLTELPPKTEVIRWVELTGAQRDMYESLRLAFDKKLRQVLSTKGVAQSQIMILDALLKLRQVCCDPRLVKLPAAAARQQEQQEPQKRQVDATGNEAPDSAKLGLLMGMLPELIDEGRRVLLFSQFTSMLSLIEEAVARHGIEYVKLTGQTKDRETPINRFQNGEVPLFLISLKAGGTGLNLTAADSVIHFDPWWNPAVEEQASSRAWRIGQDKPVFAYKLLTKGTVEEKILALQERKRNLADNLLAGAAPNQHLITAEDLDILFQPLDPAGIT